jgi:hypothetical protein
MKTKNIVNMYGDYQYFRVESFFYIFVKKNSRLGIIVF